jgi:hypothetical protein
MGRMTGDEIDSFSLLLREIVLGSRMDIVYLHLRSHVILLPRQAKTTDSGTHSAQISISQGGTYSREHMKFRTQGRLEIKLMRRLLPSFIQFQML